MTKECDINDEPFIHCYIHLVEEPEGASRRTLPMLLLSLNFSAKAV